MIHKHEVLIIAWLHGKEVEFHNTLHWDDNAWFPVDNLEFFTCDNYIFRIKPQDIVEFLDVSRNKLTHKPSINYVDKINANLKLVWDRETGDLKMSKVIK